MKKVSKVVLFLLGVVLLMNFTFIQTYAAGKTGVDWNALLKVPTQKAKKEANPENRMAHNIYVDPDLSATSGKYSGFMIDFKADKAGKGTYWALCNWEMNKSNLMRRYEVIDTYAGAYAGLQMRPDGPKAIMSFWEINYKDASGKKKKIEAKRIYPSIGDTDKFGGEGEGTNYICDYKWTKGKWYRMYLNCYQDKKGKTYVEQWVADLTTGKWTLISRFDTGLYYSYFEGSMSQFMENYDYAYANQTRTFEYRNIRVREYKQTKWKTIKTANLSVDTCYDNKKGKAVYGATKDRFYGIANGYGPDAFKKDEVICDAYTIKETKNMHIPATKAKNKPTQILIDRASLSKYAVQKLVKKNKATIIRLRGLSKSKQKVYKKWILQANKKVKVKIE